MIYVYERPYLADFYSGLVKQVLEEGQRLTPRGKPNQELRPVVLRTSQWSCLAMAGVNYRLACAEAMAVVCQWDDVAWLSRFRESIAQFSDDGEKFYGAYGPRMMLQLEHGVQRLLQDPDSRQVVAGIWEARDASSSSKDLPCNTQVYLKVRQGRLDLSVFRRSADLIWGVPYDHHVFWALLYSCASALKVMPGTLTEYIDSLHVYEPSAGFYPEDRVAKAMNAKHAQVPHPWVVGNLVDQAMALERIRKEVELTSSDIYCHELVPYLMGVK